MKTSISILSILLVISTAFSANKRILKSEFKKDRMNRVEPDYRRGIDSERDWECGYINENYNSNYVYHDYYPNNPNTNVQWIDSSPNGYGMVSTVTRPMDVNSDGNMLVVYRQYAGENTTHGQLGAGYGVEDGDGIYWDMQWNINANGDPPWGGGGVGGSGSGQARYPSAIATEEYPYAVWSEYTGNVAGWPSNCSSYGGRPYFSYDEFGWGGDSWLYPAELDPLYSCTKDLWRGSVAYGYNPGSDEGHALTVYDDWTRGGSYLYRTEAIEDGYLVFGPEQLIVNPQHLGTDSYSSSAILSMNDDGQGLVGIDGIFAGVNMDNGTCNPPASNISCNKTPMFKLTNDYGATWPRTPGNMASFDFYYVPDEVYNNIFQYWPSSVIDPCSGEVSEINDFWSWYEFDMRVDRDGNPHIVVSIIGESDNYFHFLDGHTGFYHLTIDRDHLDSPGAVNSPTGWNWSYIPLPANDSFVWNRPDGYSYLYGTMAQISLSRESDVVYVVANIANKGSMNPTYDANEDGVEDNPCDVQDFPHDLYPNWSEDIWVAKSVDNGQTWTALENLTQTPRAPEDDGPNNCSPEEQYVHAAHWSTDDRVYYQYNQPNWGFNEIGDPLGADHMNRVFLGYSMIEGTGVGGCTDPNNCSYNVNATYDNGSCGSGPYECPDGSYGCGCDGACGDTLDAPLVVDCEGVCGGMAVLDDCGVCEGDNEDMDECGVCYGDNSSCLNCGSGDVNGDDSYNVLDVVGMANCILAGSCDSYPGGGCVLDMDGNGSINVLDVVVLVNCIMAGNCSMP